MAFEWICDRLGKESRVVGAAIHRDEGAPHLHVLAVPIIDGRICWSDLRNRFGEGEDGSTRYGRMHTKFHHEISGDFGLERGKEGSTAVHERPDRVKGMALRELRKRQIHAARQLAREAGETPGGIDELREPEAWEREVMAQKAQPGDAERVTKWRRTAGLEDVTSFEDWCRAEGIENVSPLPPAPQLMELIRERVTARRRIQTELVKAKIEVEKFEKIEAEKFEEIQQEDSVEGHKDLVLAERIRAWRNRLEACRTALKTGRYESVSALAEDERVPGYSAEEWAAKKVALTEEQEAEMHGDPAEDSLDALLDAADEHYDRGRDAGPVDEATDNPGDAGRPDEKPG